MVNNYRRFYITGNDDSLVELLHNTWQIPNDVFIGPIQTNYPATTEVDVRLVVVLESPSNNEVAQRLPAVENTGKTLFNRLQNAVGIPNAELDYAWFAANGVYITNMVRYQADYAIKGGGRSQLDQRLQQALAIPSIRNQIIDELEVVYQAFPNVPVLFACGIIDDFKELVQEIERSIPGINWMGSFHTSRLAASLSWHYNPDIWGSRAKTWPDQRNEKNENPRV